MEEFLSIQKYFPQDVARWGVGTAILTTRNGNIGNNQHIKATVCLGEMNPNQKLNLFLKIMNHGKAKFLTSPQDETKKNF